MDSRLARMAGAQCRQDQRQPVPRRAGAATSATAAEQAAPRPDRQPCAWSWRTGVLTRVEPNEYMAHGTAMEPLACAAYEFMRDCDVQHVPPSSRTRRCPTSASRPDGLRGRRRNHRDQVAGIWSRATCGRSIRSKCPDDYLPQCQGGLWVTGRQWCDFVSYFPSISVEIVRVHRDETFINRLAAECAAVWAEVNHRTGE